MLECRYNSERNSPERKQTRTKHPKLFNPAAILGVELWSSMLCTAEQQWISERQLVGSRAALPNLSCHVVKTTEQMCHTVS